MTLKQEIHQMNVRTSLNLIYTMSKVIAAVMPMDDPDVVEIMHNSSETILREALDLYDRLHTTYKCENENR